MSLGLIARCPFAFLSNRILRPGSRAGALVNMLLVAAVVMLAGAQAARADSCSSTPTALTSGQSIANFSFTQGDVITATSSGLVALRFNGANGSAAGPQGQSPQVFTIPTTQTYSVLNISAIPVSFTCMGPAQTIFTVTNNTDTTAGVAANCLTATLGAGSCSLRDALAAAAASTSTGLTVNFATALAGSSGTTPFTITEAGVTLNLPSNTTIQGLTSITGSTLTNLVTVSGNNANTVFTVASGVTGASLANLTVTQGQATFGGISNAGTLSIVNSTISNNSGLGPGGGIDNAGTLIVTSSTISGNLATTGGGIYNSGALTVTDSTLSGNQVRAIGGAIFSSGTLSITNSTLAANLSLQSGALSVTGATTLTNSIVSNNASQGGNPDIVGSFTFNGVNVYGTATAGTSNGTAVLAPLGFYGGPTQTMPNLPGSGAFCTSANGSGTDQRGYFRQVAYGGTSCSDSGATQSAFSVGFSKQPASTYALGTNFSPAPVAAIYDNVSVIPATGNVVFTDSASVLAGTTTVALSSGQASLVAAKIGIAETSDTLKASYSLTLPSSTTQTITATSNAFAVIPPVNHLTLTGLPSSATAGTAISGTVTAYSDAGSTVSTTYTGPVKIRSSDKSASLPSALTLINGIANFNITLKTAASQTVTALDTSGTPTVTSSSITVNTAPAATMAATGSTTISVATSAAFGATALQVQVLDLYGNSVSGATVTYGVPSTGASATLSASTCTTNSSGMCSVTATANTVPGTYSITANVDGVNTGVTFAATNTGTATYTVTVATDTTTGTASNCTVGSTTDANCSLRDALAAATALPASSLIPVQINFSSTKFTATNSAAQNTIVLANGRLQPGSYTTIQGPTSGSGSTLTNLITVDGNQQSVVFFIPSGTAIVFSNLNITNGNGVSSNLAGGIWNSGSITVLQCSIANNKGSSNGGGGIFNSQDLVVLNSTISGNTSAGSGGGIISGSGLLSVSDTTIANNTSLGNGGGIQVDTFIVSTPAVTLSSVTLSGNSASQGGGIWYKGENPLATLALLNSVVAGNTSTGTYPNLYNTGATLSASGSIYDATSNSTLAAKLSPLSNNGGPTQTMLPVPGSAALCTQFNAAVTGVTGTDQRGFPRTTSYAGPVTCLDSGAAQTNYGLAFMQQPTDVAVNALITPSPTVQLTDNGSAVAVAGASISLGSLSSTLQGTTTELTNSSGLAAFPGLSLKTASTYQALLASMTTATVPDIATVGAKAQSASFNVIIPVDHYVWTGLPATAVAGLAFSGTVTAYADAAGTQIATGYTGPVSFTSTDTNATLPANTTTLTAGVSGPLTFTLKTAGTQTISVADASGSPKTISGNIAVGAASASVIAVSSGSSQSIAIGSAFPNPLLVKVTDAYGNLIGGNVVSFTAPSAGASATLSTASCTTSSTAGTAFGTCSVIATANGTANPTAYTVTAKATGVASGTNFTLTNNAYSPTLTVTASPTTLVYGQPVTITATSVPVSAGASYPTGTVTFYGGATGGTTLGTVTSPTNGVSTYPTYALLGQQTFAASTAADTDFNAVAKTLATAISVGKASSTLTGPATQPVFVVYSQTGSVAVTIAGQYSGAGITAPSGSIAYSMLNASNTSIASGTLTITAGVVSVPVASTLAPGLYTVTASYAGDANYGAATPISISLQVGQVQPVATITAPPAALTYGASLGIAASATYNGNTVAGAFTYAATPTGGTPTAVTAATVLPAGSYLLTANFTPTDTATYKTATTTSSLTVNKAAPSVALQLSVNPVLVQNSTTLTAAVSSAISTPTGSVSFYDNTASAALGSMNLVGGVASLPISTFTVGTHSITAIYSGDANFATLTSTAVSEQVDDFSLAISTSAGSTTSQTVLPGGTATYNFTISPTGTTTFPAAVSLTVTGLPTGAAYTITPATLAAGAGATGVTLTVMVPRQAAMLHTGEKLAPIAFALLLLPLSGRIRRRGRKLGRLTAVMLLLLGGAAGMAGLTGCGSTTGFFASAQQTYNVTITGTSGALTHSTTVTLTVQ